MANQQILTAAMQQIDADPSAHEQGEYAIRFLDGVTTFCVATFICFAAYPGAKLNWEDQYTPHYPDGTQTASILTHTDGSVERIDRAAKRAADLTSYQANHLFLFTTDRDNLRAEIRKLIGDENMARDAQRS